ncbi:MAG: glucosamine-6-phosphate deaminase [Vicinamibacterales bacterium]
MRVSVLESPQAVGDRAAARVAQVLASASRPVLGLPTGRTPLPMYARLRTAGLDWSAVRTFNLDEFVGLAPSAPGSFRRYMDEQLFAAAGLAPARIGFLRGDTADAAAECRRYDRAIEAAGGLDLLVCGLGANGHIGFNEPGPQLWGPTHVAILHPGTRAANAALFGGDADAVPERALTMGMTAILRARAVLVLATGAAKAAAVAAMIDGPLTTALPASWLQVHGAVEVLLDPAAAAMLPAAVVGVEISRSPRP